jgi:MFS family permease
MIKSAVQDYGYENDDILTDVISSFSTFACALGEIVGPIFAGLLTDQIGFKSTCAVASVINLAAGIVFAVGTGVFSCTHKKYKKRSLLINTKVYIEDN